MGRAEEARDIARLALRLPWATFTGGFQPLRDAAGLSGGTAEVRRALEEQDEMSTMPSGLRTTVKTQEERQLAKALWLLNAATAGEASWEAVREPVAALYEQGGQRDVAGFIRAGSSQQI